MHESHHSQPEQPRSDYGWLLPLLLRRRDLAALVVSARRRLADLPRPRRMRLLRRLGVSLSSVTLLLLLAGLALDPAAQAETTEPLTAITVVDQQVEISNDNKCSLIEAIRNANDTRNGQPHTDCAAGNPSGADTLILPQDGLFTLTRVHKEDEWGSNGLPWITSEVTIDGNGATIRRESSAPAFRLFSIGKRGTLSVDNVTLDGGGAGGSSSAYDGIRNIGMFVLNEVVVTNSRISGNHDGIVLLRDCGESNEAVIAASEIVSNGVGIRAEKNCSPEDDDYGDYYYGGGSFFVSDSLISGNGEGIYLTNGSGALIRQTAIVENRGDGISIRTGGIAMYDSTVSHNGESGISSSSGVIWIYGSTIAFNGDKGLFSQLNSLFMYDSIVAGNRCLDLCWYGYEAVMMYEYGEGIHRSLIGHSGLTTDQLGYGVNRTNILASSDGNHPTPLSGILDAELRMNGGNTPTHALVFGSPAIDKLRSQYCRGEFDQRGSPFQRGVDLGGLEYYQPCDVGAFEMQPAPAVSGLSPTAGPAGSVVTIFGESFLGVRQVSFNGVAAATFTVNSATKITAVVPAGAATGKIGVTTPSGTATSESNFNVTTPAPMISSFAPASGPVGTSVTINGTNLIGATGVSFDGVAAATFTVNSATQITAVVPPGATSGKIRVTTPGGTVASATNFTVTIPAPMISGFSPASGPVGTTVTINGTGLTGATGVSFGGADAILYGVNSPTQITAIVPAGATTGRLAVTTPGGTATSSADFTVLRTTRYEAFIPAISR